MAPSQPWITDAALWKLNQYFEVKLTGQSLPWGVNYQLFIRPKTGNWRWTNQGENAAQLIMEAHDTLLLFMTSW